MRGPASRHLANTLAIDALRASGNLPGAFLLSSMTHKGQEVAMEGLGMFMGWLGLLSVSVLLGITWMLIQTSKLSDQLDTLIKRADRAPG